MIKKIIFVLIIIALLGGGYWYVSQKPATSPIGVDTSDWQTFRNEKYGYEVKYPQGAEDTKEYASGNSRFSVDLEKFLNVPQEIIEEKRNKGGLGVSVSVVASDIKNPNNLSVRDWVYQNIHNQKQAMGPGQEKDTTFAGEPAYVNKNDFTSGIYSFTLRTIYVIKNSKLYEIVSLGKPQSPTPAWLAHPYYQYLERSIPISEAILNSFRFVN